MHIFSNFGVVLGSLMVRTSSPKSLSVEGGVDEVGDCDDALFGVEVFPSVDVHCRLR